MMSVRVWDDPEGGGCSSPCDLSVADIVSLHGPKNWVYTAALLDAGGLLVDWGLHEERLVR